MELVNLDYTATNWKKEIENGLNFTHNLMKTYLNGDEKTKKKILIGIGTNPKILNKKAHFITPKHLKAIKTLVNSQNIINDRDEPKKSLVEQGDSCGILLPFYSSAEEKG